MSRWLALALLAIGCGHPAPPPTSTPLGTTHTGDDAGVTSDAPVALDVDFARLAERSVALYNDLAKALADAKGDCAAATGKVDGIATAYADVTTANSRVLHAGRDSVIKLRAALEPHQAELDASAKAIVQSDTMAKCSQDPAFAKAIDRLVGEPQ